MSNFIVGVGASHSTMMNTDWDRVSGIAGVQDYRRALDTARDIVQDARADVVIVVGSNHFRGMFLDLMPAFTIGVAECDGTGEAQTPKGALPVDEDLAREIAWSMTEREFDIAFSLRLTVDHGITHSLQYLVPDLDIPIVPIVVNSFAPPLPTLQRCVAFGHALGEIVANDGLSKRVVVIASGGLSHHLPWPKWFESLNETDRFLVEAFLEGRSEWERYEERRRSITRAGEPRISPDFDRAFLEEMREGRLDDVARYSSEDVERLAGNGGQEIRSWVIAAAALGARCDTLAYAPVPELLTGLAVAAMRPAGE
jgi:2,3-dihydroxyphenylpropionate 1,2-dioxygenase